MQIQKMDRKVLDYNLAATKAGGGDHFYVDQSGQRYVATRNTKSGGVPYAVNMRTGEQTANTRYRSDEEMIALMRDSIYPQIYETQEQINEAVDSLCARRTRELQNAELFWQKIAALESDINNYPVSAAATKGEPGDPRPDTEIDDIFQDDPIPTPPPKPPHHRLTVSHNSDNKLTWLQEIQDHSKAYGTGEYCGQWICAFLVGAYDYKQIKLEDIASEIGEGAMRLTDISRVIGRYSNGYLGADYSSKSQWDAYWHIREGLPVLRLNSFFTHWTLLYGSYRIERALATNYYFMQIDNGTLISYDWRNSRTPYDPACYEEMVFTDMFYNLYD